MDGPGLKVSTVDMVTAADGFAAASTKTQRHATALEEVLKPYALHPDRFQGPQADAFRRLYREIADDLAVIKKEATEMSTLVTAAKTEYSKHVHNAANSTPKPGGGAQTGGSVLQGLTGN